MGKYYSDYKILKVLNDKIMDFIMDEIKTTGATMDSPLTIYKTDIYEMFPEYSKRDIDMVYSAIKETVKADGVKGLKIKNKRGFFS